MKTLIVAASLILGVAAIPVVASAQDYPPCGPGQTDKCTQTYEGHGTTRPRRARRARSNWHVHNAWHHANRHHHHHRSRGHR